MFLHYLVKQKTQKLHLFTQYHMIILFKNIVHRLFIDSFIPLKKQPTADVQKVLPSHKLTPADASPLADSSVDNTLLQTVSNVNQSLVEFVNIVDLHLIHTYMTAQIL